MVMKLATRQEGNMIYKAIEYREKVTEYMMRNQQKDYGFYTREEFIRRYNFHIGRFHGLLEAIAADLKASEDDVMRMINNIERRM